MRRFAQRPTACLAVAMLAGLGLLASGCGGSKPPSVASVATTTSSSAVAGTNATGGAAGSGSPPSQTQLQQDALKYARCMRADGVPNFPDPNAGGGFVFQAGAGVDPSSPAFKAARAKCQKFMGGIGPTPGSTTHPSAQWLAKMVKAAQCMRRLGVPDFPDPTTTVPSLPGFVGVISDIEGAIFVFPATLDTQSPAFTRAAAACQFPLHNH
jgi:hypothetical protein